MQSLPSASGPFGRTDVRRARIPFSSVLLLAGAALLGVQMAVIDRLPTPVRDDPAASPAAAGPAVAAGLASRPVAPAPLPVSGAPGSAPAAGLTDAAPGLAAAPAALPAQEAPRRPRLPQEDPVGAAETAEAALGLTPGARAVIQRRLALLGFGDGGVDGIFGPGTRAAIHAWQTEAGLAPTGYLDAGSRSLLTEASEPRYRAWRAARAERRRLEDTREIATMAATLFSEPERPRRCVRRGDGSVIANQSLICDLTGMGEGFATLVRSLGTL